LESNDIRSNFVGDSKIEGSEIVDIDKLNEKA
jgi:hypothetical protein